MSGILPRAPLTRTLGAEESSYIFICIYKRSRWAEERIWSYKPRKKRDQTLSRPRHACNPRTLAQSTLLHAYAIYSAHLHTSPHYTPTPTNLHTTNIPILRTPLDLTSLPKCVAVCGSVLQCVAVCCSAWQFTPYIPTLPLHTCVAVCCSVLQRVAVCCSVLQCLTLLPYPYIPVLQCVAVCCSVLQCVAVCCSALNPYPTPTYLPYLTTLLLQTYKTYPTPTYTTPTNLHTYPTIPTLHHIHTLHLQPLHPTLHVYPTPAHRLYEQAVRWCGCVLPVMGYYVLRHLWAKLLYWNLIDLLRASWRRKGGWILM